MNRLQLVTNLTKDEADQMRKWIVTLWQASKGPQQQEYRQMLDMLAEYHEDDEYDLSKFQIQSYLAKQIIARKKAELAALQQAQQQQVVAQTGDFKIPKKKKEETKRNDTAKRRDGTAKRRDGTVKKKDDDDDSSVEKTDLAIAAKKKIQKEGKPKKAAQTSANQQGLDQLLTNIKNFSGAVQEIKPTALEQMVGIQTRGRSKAPTSQLGMNQPPQQFGMNQPQPFLPQTPQRIIQPSPPPPQRIIQPSPPLRIVQPPELPTFIPNIPQQQPIEQPQVQQQMIIEQAPIQPIQIQQNQGMVEQQQVNQMDEEPDPLQNEFIAQDLQVVGGQQNAMHAEGGALGGLATRKLNIDQTQVPFNDYGYQEASQSARNRFALMWNQRDGYSALQTALRTAGLNKPWNMLTKEENRRAAQIYKAQKDTRATNLFGENIKPKGSAQQLAQLAQIKTQRGVWMGKMRDPTSYTMVGKLRVMNPNVKNELVALQKQELAAKTSDLSANEWSVYLRKYLPSVFSNNLLNSLAAWLAQSPMIKFDSKTYHILYTDKTNYAKQLSNRKKIHNGSVVFQPTINNDFTLKLVGLYNRTVSIWWQLVRGRINGWKEDVNQIYMMQEALKKSQKPETKAKNQAKRKLKYIMDKTGSSAAQVRGMGARAISQWFNTQQMAQITNIATAKRRQGAEGLSQLIRHL